MYNRLERERQRDASGGVMRRLSLVIYGVQEAADPAGAENWETK